jgi:hypothetical protein
MGTRVRQYVCEEDVHNFLHMVDIRVTFIFSLCLPVFSTNSNKNITGVILVMQSFFHLGFNPGVKHLGFGTPHVKGVIALLI